VAVDLGILHSASIWLELHGDEAVPVAGRMAAEMRARGDLVGADIWLRIIVALGEMQNGSVGIAS